jgi:hypothetical protein
VIVGHVRASKTALGASHFLREMLWRPPVLRCFARAGRSSLIGAHGCFAPSWSESPVCVQFGPGRTVFFPFRIWRSAAARAVPSVQFQFASCRALPKHEFVSLKFWNSIKTGHILGSFCQTTLQAAPVALVVVSSNISCNDIFHVQFVDTYRRRLHSKPPAAGVNE